MAALVAVSLVPAIANAEGPNLDGDADARVERAPAVQATDDGDDGPAGDDVIVDTGAVDLNLVAEAETIPQPTARADTEARRLEVEYRTAPPPNAEPWLLPDGTVHLVVAHDALHVIVLAPPAEAKQRADVPSASPPGLDAGSHRALGPTSVDPDAAPTCRESNGPCGEKPVEFVNAAVPSVEVAYSPPAATASVNVPPPGADATARGPTPSGTRVAGVASATEPTSHATLRMITKTPRIAPDGAAAAPRDPSETVDLAAGRGPADATVASTPLGPSSGREDGNWDRAAVAVAASSVAIALPFLVWLFNRLTDRRSFLDDPSRARVLEAIRASPGATATDLERATTLHRTTAAYHARRLQQAGYVAVVREGGVNRYFSTTTPADSGLRFAVCLTRYAPLRRILEWLAQRPDATPRELAVALGVSRRAVAYHLQRLLDAGLVTRADAPGGTSLVRVSELGRRALDGTSTLDGTTEATPGSA